MYWKEIDQRCLFNSIIINPINCVVAHTNDSHPMGVQGWPTTYNRWTNAPFQ